jgi:hypothetical protein
MSFLSSIAKQTLVGFGRLRRYAAWATAFSYFFAYSPLSQADRFIDCDPDTGHGCGGGGNFLDAIVGLILFGWMASIWGQAVVARTSRLWPFVTFFGGIGVLIVANARPIRGQILGWILIGIAMFVAKLRYENPSKENYVAKSEPVTQKDRDISSEVGNEARGGPRTSNTAESSLIKLNKVDPSSYCETENPESADQLYTEALKCFPNNEGQAALLMRMAAIKGHRKAHYYYGHWFLHGWGLEKDYSMAAHWLTKAADQGIHEALYDLGRMHFEGKGFPQSVSEATIYWNKASAQGNSEAQYALSKLGISSIRPYTNIVRQTEGGSFAQCPKCAAEFNPAVFKECPVCGYTLDDKSIGLP